MTIQEFIINTHKEEMYLQRPVIFCNDGFFMSVQGNGFCYCSPKGVQPHYHSMEIGFPSDKEPLIMK